MPAGALPNGNDAQPPAEEKGMEAASLIDLLMRQAPTNLDDIEGPTAEELDALDELDDLDALVALDDVALETPAAQSPAASPALSLLAELEEPELVSLEGLDDEAPTAAPEDDLDDFDDLPDDVESLIEDYIDLDLEDDELEDEGYDLDDDDFNSYRDLYGDDDAIVPSFREGEFAEEEDGDTDYYNELR